MESELRKKSFFFILSLNFYFFPLSSVSSSSIRVTDMAEVSDASNISGDNSTWTHDAMDRYSKRMSRVSILGPRKLEVNTLPVRRILNFPGRLSDNLSFGCRGNLEYARKFAYSSEMA